MSQYCPACGSQIDGDSKFCTTCGYSLEVQNNNQMNNQGANTANNNAPQNNYDINQNFTTSAGIKEYTNGMAITGLVISIASLILCCGSISIIGLVFSIIGLNKAKQNNGNGKGLAIAGLIINIIGILVMLFWLFITIIPFFAVASEIENLSASIIGLLF